MKKIGVLSVIQHAVKFYLAKPKEFSDGSLDGCDGLYCPTSGNVYVNRETAINPLRVQETVVHEAVHALLDLTGARDMLKAKLGLDDQAYEDFEEVLVRMITPSLISMMPSLQKLSNLAAIKRAIKTAKVTSE